jgi:hypothetical protein
MFILSASNESLPSFCVKQVVDRIDAEPFNLAPCKLCSIPLVDVCYGRPFEIEMFFRKHAGKRRLKLSLAGFWYKS